MAVTPMQSAAQEQAVSTAVNVQWASGEMVVYATVWKHLSVQKMLTSIESAINCFLCCGLIKICHGNFLFFDILFSPYAVLKRKHVQMDEST